MIWEGRQTSARPDAKKGKAFRWISVQDVVLAGPSRTAKEASNVEPSCASCSFAVKVELAAAQLGDNQRRGQSQRISAVKLAFQCCC